MNEEKHEEKSIFDKVGTLAIFLAISTCVQGMFSTGCLVTTLSSMEKRFGLTTSESSFILAGFDIGVLLFSIPCEILTRKVRSRGILLGTSRSRYNAQLI